MSNDLNGVWEYDIFENDNGGLTLEGQLTVTVTREDNGSNAVIYSDVDGNTTIANPATFSGGKVKFYAAQNRRYKVRIEDDSGNIREFEDQSTSQIAEVDSVDSVATLRVSSFPANLERLWLTGYYGAGTGGADHLYRVGSGFISSDDNDVTEFVDNDGVKWARPEKPFVTHLDAGIKGDGTNEKARFQSLFSVADSVIVGSASSTYYLGALADDEDVFSLSGRMGLRLYFYDAEFTFETPPSSNARVFSLDGTVDCKILGRPRLRSTDYTIAANGTTGVIALGIPSDAAACKNIEAEVYAEKCVNGFDVRRSASNHRNFDIDIETVDTYYGCSFGGGGNFVRGKVNALRQVRSYLAYNVRNHDLFIQSSECDSISTGDVNIKTFTGDNTKNIKVKAEFTDSNSTSYAVRLEHDQQGADIGNLRNISIDMDDVGNGPAKSFVFRSSRDSVVEDTTDNVTNQIYLDGFISGSVDFQTSPNNLSVFHIRNAGDAFTTYTNMSSAGKGFLFKKGSGSYRMYVKGDIANDPIRIPVGQLNSGGEFAVELVIGVLSDQGSTSSSANLYERRVFFGYTSSGTVNERTSNSLETSSNTANLSTSMTTSGEYLEINFSGSALTTDAVATADIRFM